MGNSQIKKGNSESLGETDVFDNEQVEDENNEQIKESGPEQIEESGPEQIEESGPEQIEESGPEQVEVPLSSIPVNDKNGAFQLLIAFINLAYARGAYKQDEVEKIIECINKFVV